MQPYIIDVEKKEDVATLNSSKTELSNAKTRCETGDGTEFSS